MPTAAAAPMRISHKLGLSFTLFGLLLLGSALFAVEESESALKQAIGQRLQLLARTAAHEVAQTIGGREQELVALAAALDLTTVAATSSADYRSVDDATLAAIDSAWSSGATPAALIEALNHPLAQSLRRYMHTRAPAGHPLFAEIYLTNERGVVIATTGRTSDFLQADEAWYQRATANSGIWLGPMEFDASAHSRSVDLVLPLRLEGRLVGIVKAVLDLAAIQAIIESTEESERHRTLRLSLVDRDGYILFGTPSPTSSAPTESDHDLPAAAFAHHLPSWEAVTRNGLPISGAHPWLVRGQERMVALEAVKEPLLNQGWSLVAEIDGTEAFAPVADSRRRLLLGFVLIACVVAALGLLLTRQIARPLLVMSDAARRIGKGRLDTRLQVQGDDEIALLGTALNRMTEELKLATVSKEYVDSILGNMSDLLVMLATDGQIQVVNPAACQLLGYRADELVGQQVERICRTPFLADPQLTDLVLQGTITNLEHICLGRDGREIPVLFSLTVMRDIGHDLQGIVMVGVDISRRLNPQPFDTGAA